MQKAEKVIFEREVALFFDVEDGFYKVRTNNIWESLQVIGVANQLVSWVKSSYLSHRTVDSAIGDCHREMKVS